MNAVDATYPDKQREIYPSAPLRFVAFELTFPPVPALQEETTKRELRRQLRERFPVPSPVPAPPDGGISFQVSAGGVPQMVAPGFQLMNRDRTASTTVTQTSLLVQTSAYTKFEEYREILSVALAALGAVEDVPGMQRLGIRYIDEIRVPAVERPGEWAPYLHQSLHGPTDLLDEASAERTQGLAEYRVAEQRRVVLRYGAASGWAVDPDGLLRLQTREDGPYFLLDIDSFWMAPAEHVPEFSVDHAIEICNDLHKPVRRLFEAAITERLRNELLRKERS